MRPWNTGRKTESEVEGLDFGETEQLTMQPSL